MPHFGSSIFGDYYSVGSSKPLNAARPIRIGKSVGQPRGALQANRGQHGLLGACR
jgi:hypothetical protein